MATFDDLDVGDRFETPSRLIDDALHAQLIEIGGYTHPLFTDAEYLRSSPFDRSPLPGQAVLLVMGGLIEQTGRFDDTVIALLGFEQVRFIAPAFADTALRVVVEVVGKEQRGDGTKGLLVMTWRAVGDEGRPFVEATARMLFRVGSDSL